MRKLVLSLGLVCLLVTQTGLAKIPPLNKLVGANETVKMSLHEAPSDQPISIACTISNLSEDNTNLLVSTDGGHLGPVTSDNPAIKITLGSNGYTVALLGTVKTVNLTLPVIPHSGGLRWANYTTLSFKNSQAATKNGHYFTLICEKKEEASQETNKVETNENTVETSIQS